MLQVRRSAERGYFDHGWLKSYHTFSFADYHDPAWIAYGPLRVINDDRVAPGQGFGKHGHRDMEIITYLLEGELEHQDSMGNGSIIRVGDVQRMSAGTGVTHSEFNPSDKQEVHLLQIWIHPEVTRLAPGYEQKHFAAADKRGRLLSSHSLSSEPSMVRSSRGWPVSNGKGRRNSTSATSRVRASGRCARAAASAISRTAAAGSTGTPSIA